MSGAGHGLNSAQLASSRESGFRNTWRNVTLREAAISQPSEGSSSFWMKHVTSGADMSEYDYIIAMDNGVIEVLDRSKLETPFEN